MNPLNFLERLFTLRVIERELSEAKARNKELEVQLQERDSLILNLQEQIKLSENTNHKFAPSNANERIVSGPHAWMAN